MFSSIAADEDTRARRGPGRGGRRVGRLVDEEEGASSGCHSARLRVRRARLPAFDTSE